MTEERLNGPKPETRKPEATTEKRGAVCLLTEQHLTYTPCVEYAYRDTHTCEVPKEEGSASRLRFFFFQQNKRSALPLSPLGIPTG